MLPLLSLLNHYLMIDIIAPALPLAEASPIVLRVRDSLRMSGSGNWMLWSVIGTAVSGLFLLIIWNRWQNRHQFEVKNLENPDKLFKSLLEQLDLSAREKTVLGKMADDTRLRHPSQMLLSPYLLNWSRDLWLKEKSCKTTKQQRNKPFFCFHL